MRAGRGKKVIWARCWRLMNFFWWQKVIAKLNVAVFTHFDTMNDSNCKLNEYFSITCSWAISFFFVLVIFCIFKACFWRSFKQEEKQMPLRAARPLLKWLYFCFVSSKNPLLKEFQTGSKTVVITSCVLCWVANSHACRHLAARFQSVTTASFKP